MLDLAGVTSGCRVLDVAAGAGDQTLQAATRAMYGENLDVAVATKWSKAGLAAPEEPTRPALA